MRTTAQFRRRILKYMDEVDGIYGWINEDPEKGALRCGNIVTTVGNQAARLGLPKLFQRSRRFEAWVDPLDAKAFLSHCLEAVPAKRNRKPKPNRLTPPVVAKMLGVSPDTVRQWIEAGELKATNIASKTAKRPRYRVEPEALAEFEKRRGPRIREEAPRRRRRAPGDKPIVTRY